MIKQTPPDLNSRYGFALPSKRRHPRLMRKDYDKALEIEKGLDLSQWTQAPDRFQDHFEWAASQTVFPPKYQRCPDWKEELERTFDKWSMRPYESSRTCCFIFVLDCLDAMLGTDLVSMHSGGWVGAAAFGQYIMSQGGLDWFDRVGMRCTDKEAQPGDLCQFEPIDDRGPAGKYLHFHWGVCTEKRFEVVSFEVGGVTLFDAHKSIIQSGGEIKCWRIG